MKILTLSILSLTAVCVTAGAQDATAPAGSTVQADKQFLNQLEHTDQLGQNPVVGQNPVQAADTPAAPPAANEKQAKPAHVAKKTAPPRRTNETAPVKTADQSGPVAQERPQTEIRPVEKSPRRDVNTRAKVATTERVDPAEENNEARPVEGRGKRQVNTRPVATATTRVDSVDENNDSRAVERKWKKDVNPRATVATTERIDPPGATNPEAVETQPPRRGSRERTSRNTTLDPFYDNSAPPPAKRETRTSKTSAAPAVPVQEPADVAAGPQKTVTVTKTVTVLPAPQTPPREHDDENGFFHRLFHPKDRSGD